MKPITLIVLRLVTGIWTTSRRFATKESTVRMNFPAAIAGSGLGICGEVSARRRGETILGKPIGAEANCFTDFSFGCGGGISRCNAAWQIGDASGDIRAGWARATAIPLPDGSEP